MLHSLENNHNIHRNALNGMAECHVRGGDCGIVRVEG